MNVVTPAHMHPHFFVNLFVQDYMYPDGTKVREYPNGTCKRYNLDGTVESIQQHEFSQDETSHGLSVNTNSDMNVMQSQHSAQKHQPN